MFGHIYSSSIFSTILLLSNYLIMNRFLSLNFYSIPDFLQPQGFHDQFPHLTIHQLPPITHSSLATGLSTVSWSCKSTYCASTPLLWDRKDKGSLGHTYVE